MQSVDWKYSGIQAVIDTSEAWLQEVLMRSVLSTEFFTQYFMPGTFERDKMTWQRKENLLALNDESIPYGAVCAYRGFGKTAQLIGQIVKNIVFRRHTFILYTARVQDYASEQTDNVKSELMTNPMIKALWGNLKPKAFEGESSVFSKDCWFVSCPTTGRNFGFVAPKGSNQQVNGALIRIDGKMRRPDWIVVDDGEDRKEILNEDNRVKYARWIYGALLPCVPDQRPNAKTRRWKAPAGDPFWRAPWRVWYQDTIKHEAGLMQKITSDPNWECRVYPKVKVNKGVVKSLVPNLLSDAQCQSEYDGYKDRGDLDTYAMEFECKPQARDNSTWTDELFLYYNEAAYDINGLPDQDKFIICDPAHSSKPESDDSAWLVCGVRCQDRQVYCRDQKNVRKALTEVISDIYKDAIQYATRIVAVETTGAEEPLMYMFENVRSEMGLEGYIELVELDGRKTPKGDYGPSVNAAKVARASFLLPMYKAGNILHDITFKEGPMERQMVSYPKCGSWHAIDCASYIPTMLRRGGRFWETPPKSPREQRKIPGFLEQKQLTEAINAGVWRCQ